MSYSRLLTHVKHLSGLPIQGSAISCAADAVGTQLKEAKTKEAAQERVPFRVEREQKAASSAAGPRDDARVVELNFERRLPAKLSNDPFKHQRQLHSLFVDAHNNKATSKPLEEEQQQLKLEDQTRAADGSRRAYRRPATAGAALVAAHQQQKRIAGHNKNFLNWEV